MNNTTPKQIRINNDELAALKKIALEQDRSVSSVIRLAIKSYLKAAQTNSKGLNTALDCPEIQKDEDTDIPF